MNTNEYTAEYIIAHSEKLHRAVILHELDSELEHLGELYNKKRAQRAAAWLEYEDARDAFNNIAGA